MINVYSIYTVFRIATKAIAYYIQYDTRTMMEASL